MRLNMLFLLIPLVFLFSGFRTNTEHIDIDIVDQVADSTQIDYVPLDTTRYLTNTSYVTFIVESFVIDAVDRGLDSLEVVEHINRLDLIFVGEFINDDIWGYNLMMEDSLVTTGIRGSIFINEKTLSDWKFFRITLYHELGHWFGVDHCECDDEIMMDNKFSDEKLLYVYNNWDVMVTILMYDIKENFNEETSMFDLPDTLFVH